MSRGVETPVVMLVDRFGPQEGIGMAAVVERAAVVAFVLWED